MSTFMIFWNAWVYMFRPLPSGDPYIAAVVLVALVIVAVKMVRRASKYFYI